MENKTKIILSRRSEWINRSRNITVYIDGNEAGRIRNGSTEEFLVSPGSHQLQCRIAWYSSPVIVVNMEPQEVEYLVVKSGMKYYWPLFFLLLAGVLLNLLFTYRRDERPWWMLLVQTLLILPALVYFLYYMTAGRKKYLQIEKDQDNFFAS